MALRRVEPPPNAPHDVPRALALVVGIGRYRLLPSDKDLDFAESDALAVTRTLTSPEAGGFAPENVHTLIGAQATLARIKGELEGWLVRTAAPADRVVVYFAGHGLVHAGKGYLAPHDIDPSDIRGTSYPMAALGSVLANNVKARRKILLVDACHSDKISAESTKENLDAQIEELPVSFLTVTASREREFSYEDPHLATGAGVFSYFLVRGWQGDADNDPCDGLITANELTTFVQEEVRKYARARALYQNVSVRGDFDPELVLGFHRGTCVNGREATSTSTGALVIQVNMAGVAVYVDDKLIGEASPGAPLNLPGVAGGNHVVAGVRAGYEPERKQVTVLPGQDNPVVIRIRYPIENRRSAVEQLEKGEKLLFSHHSAFDPAAVFVPRSQSLNDLRAARTCFQRALAEDPGYAKAEYDLGMVDRLLSGRTSVDHLRRAVALDPSYTEARLEYAGALIEEGDADTAIRELNEVIRLEPSCAEAYSMVARAYSDKGVWDRSADAARTAVRIAPNNAQSHLWLADALRHQASQATNPQMRRALTDEAIDEYTFYAEKTRFANPVLKQFLFYGFAIGTRSHADRKISHANLQSAAYLGLCECEQRIGYLQRAEKSCKLGLKAAPNDALGLFLLGNVYRDLFNLNSSRTYLEAARRNYAASLASNSHLEETAHAVDYIQQIDRILPLLER
jgi:tetratricopeptide (TPR) repeat protein